MGIAVLVALALVAVSATLGSAAWRIAGLPPSPYLSPLAGFCFLLVLVQPVLYLPGRGWTAVGLIAVLLAAALSRRNVRRDLVVALPEGVPLVLAAVFLLCLPFLVSGRFGILGFGDNDDLVMHLSALRWIAHREIPETDTVAGVSYPIGPQALGGAITVLGPTAVQALTAVMAMGPILSCLAALTALPRLRRSARWALALLAGLSYLAASYYAQASHKEVIAAAPILGFALVLPAVVRAARNAASAAQSRTPGGETGGGTRAAALAAARGGLVPALLVGGITQTISAGGALWPLGTLGFWGVIWLARRRHDLGSLRAAMPSRAIVVPVLAGLVATGVLVLIVVAPELTRMIDFQSTPFANEREGGTGNLNGSLPPWQGLLGVWLNPDFRFATHLPVLTVVLILGALVLIVIAAVHWVRRGPDVLAALLAADWLLWVGLELFKNPYNAAKGLAMMSPLMGLALVTGAAAAWSRRDRLKRRAAARTTAIRAATLCVLIGAAVSTVLALRDGVVGPNANADQLQVLGDAAGPNSSTALLDPSDYGSWYLFEQRPFRPRLLYSVRDIPLRPEKGWHAGEPVDFDTIAPQAINDFDWVVASRTAFHSAPPSGFEITRQTPQWTLWHRVGTAPQRQTLDEGWRPGATLDCSTPEGRAISRRAGTALVRTPPVVGSPAGWHGTAEDAGSHATYELQLPPGRWDLSLQYVSRNALTVSAPGMGPKRLPAILDRMASFFSAGTVTSDGGPVTVRVDVDELPLFGRLLGAKGTTRALNSPGFHALGTLAATRHGEQPRHVPLAQACGRYVDAYTLG